MSEICLVQFSHRALRVKVLSEVEPGLRGCLLVLSSPSLLQQVAWLHHAALWGGDCGLDSTSSEELKVWKMGRIGRAVALNIADIFISSRIDTDHLQSGREAF